MSLESDLIKHRIFLERLALGFAKDYKKHLNQAKNKTKRALKENNTFLDRLVLQEDLRKTFDRANKQLLQNIKQFTNYELDFLSKLLERHLGISINQQTVNINNNQIEVKTTLNKQSIPVDTVYQQYSEQKVQQYADVLQQEKTKQERQEEIENKTNNLFNTQNIVLAGLAVAAASRAVGKEIAARNSQIRIRWSSVLEPTTCPICEGLHGQVFTAETVPAYPQHSRCKCSLIYEV